MAVYFAGRRANGITAGDVNDYLKTKGSRLSGWVEELRLLYPKDTAKQRNEAFKTFAEVKKWKRKTPIDKPENK